MHVPEAGLRSVGHGVDDAVRTGSRRIPDQQRLPPDGISVGLRTRTPRYFTHGPVMSILWSPVGAVYTRPYSPRMPLND